LKKRLPKFSGDVNPMIRSSHITLLIASLCLALLTVGCKKPPPGMRFLSQNRIINQIKRPFRKALRPGEKEPVQLSDQVLKSEVRVMGWEPAMQAQLENCQTPGKYYFNLLSHLMVANYDVNPSNGEMRNGEQLATTLDTLFIQCAKEKHGTHAPLSSLLLVSMYGDFQDLSPARCYRMFLGKSREANKAREHLGTQLAKHCRKSWVDGVVLDFPNLSGGLEEEFVKFVQSLSNKLMPPGDEPPSQLYLRLPNPKENPSYRKVIQKLRARVSTTCMPIISGIIVRSYPIDLSGERQSEDLLASYAAQSPENIDYLTRSFEGEEDFKACEEVKKVFHPVIEFPFWGLRVEGSRSAPRLAGEKVRVPLSNIIPEEGEVPELDKERGLMYLSTGAGKGILYHTPQTISKRMDMIQKKPQASGVAFSYLGYGSDKQIWEGVNEHYGEESPNILYPSIAFLLLFFPMGLLFAVVRYWPVRNLLAYHRIMFIYFWIIVLMFLVVAGWCYFWDDVPSPWNHYVAIGLFAMLLVFPAGRKFRSMFYRYFR
jgi:hypothetical protein